MVKIVDRDGNPYKTMLDHQEPAEVQVAQAMEAAGIKPPPNIRIDGQLHRFPTKNRDDSGWYLIFPDQPIAGRFGCWRDQIDCVFRAEIGREYTVAEQMAVARRHNEARQRREEARQRKADVAADTVEKIWRDASHADPAHPYLARKGIKPSGARIGGDGRLVVPLYAQDGSLSSLQYISDTDKKYHPGGIVKGCLWQLGDPDGGVMFVAEGFATAATIHEVSQRPCAVAYSANNLPLVVEHLREKYGAQQEIVIVADNDASGVGKAVAEQASAKSGARIVMPPEEGDANDYHLAGGDLLGLLLPPIDNWLESYADFIAEPAPIRWHIKHWLQSDALVMIHGPSGGGKTFLVLDMVLAIAAAKPSWHGHKTRHCHVAYLAGEGHHGLRGRVKAWGQHHNVKNADIFVSKSGLDLNTPQGYAKTANALRSMQTPPGVVVVDTLHRFLAGDENSSVDAKTMLDACAAIMAEFRCTVILVHHTGVNAEAQHRARGSSAWRGALDIEISVVPGAVIEVIQRKSKDAEEAEPLYVQLQPVALPWTDEDGETVTSAVLVQAEKPAKAKKPSALENYVDYFQRAWWEGGGLVKDGKPHLDRDVLRAKFEAEGRSPGTIRNYLSKSNNGKMIGTLIGARLIVETGSDGWSIIDAEWSGKLINEKENG